MLPKMTREAAILTTFFSTEMWERYGFYIVQSLLALFLSLKTGLDDAHTYLLVGSFTALTYVSPIVGGWIADRYLGQRHAVLFGAVLLFIAYLVLAFALDLQGLLTALSIIAIGTGLLKPNISAMLGKQYEPTSRRRDSAFTIFYLGITTGIILGTTLPSKLQALYGWQMCFLSACLGLIFAFCVFFFGTRALNIKEYAVVDCGYVKRWSVSCLSVLVSFIVYYAVLKHVEIADLFFVLVAIFSLCLVLRIACREHGDQRRKILCLLVLFMISVFFWSFYFQMFTDFTLLIARVVKPTVFGMQFPAPYYVCVESIGMLLLGIVLAILWSRIKMQNIAYKIALKFTGAVFVMLVAYGIVLLTLTCSNDNHLVSPWPMMGAYLVISLAELLLSPIGLAAVTNLANSDIVSTLMGVFLVTLGLGGFLSGQLANIAAIDNTQIPLGALKLHYLHSFQTISLLLFGAFVITCLLLLVIKRLSRDIVW